MRGRFLIELTVACLIASAPAAAATWTGILSSSRATDWTKAGVSGGIPNRTTICANLNPGASHSQINSAISSCPANQVVFLNAGTYNLSSGISFGSKSNVTLRGAGADKTFLVFSGGTGCGASEGVICSNSGGVNADNPQNSTSWTAGYAPGTTVITVGSASGLSAGRLVILDQVNDSSDSGNIFVCSSSSCTDEGGNAPGRSNRGQQQMVKVVSVSGNQVTVTPPIRMPNWRSSQSPGVFWNAGGPIISGIGIENLSIDNTNARDQNGVMFVHISDSWVKGVRSINTDRNHVWLYRGMRNTIRDSYFYGTQNQASQSYGIEAYGTGDNLIENNILQHVTGPIKHNGQDTGSVVAYNFSIDDSYTPSSGWMIPTLGYHEVGVSYVLHEGNDGLGVLHDNIHGTIHFNTEFRNHYYGDVWNSPSKNSNTAVVNIAAFGRYFNIIGNVLGRSGYYTTYESNLSDNPRAIYSLGYPRGPVNDPQTKATMMRWGNYDTVNNAVRWQGSEVPSGLSVYSNPVPGGQSLPPSFYLSSKPAFFGNVAWPPIGPDVSGGNVSGWGGHANKIPARLCYENTSKSGNILNFSAAACYGNGTTPPPPTGSACDVNGSGQADVVDVQQCVNQLLGLSACGTADINNDGSCTVIDVQRVVNAVLGGQCVTQ